MKIYTDDILVKSRVVVSHVRDLKEAFQVLRQYDIQLNPAKCVFGVKSRRFLGYMVI